MRFPKSGGPGYRIKFLEPDFDWSGLTRDPRIHEHVWLCAYMHTPTHPRSWGKGCVNPPGLLLLCSWRLYEFLVSFMASGEDFAVGVHFRAPRKLKTKIPPSKGIPTLCSCHVSIPCHAGGFHRLHRQSLLQPGRSAKDLRSFSLLISV